MTLNRHDAKAAKEKGYALHSALRISAVLAHLRDVGHLGPDQFQRCMDFIASVRF